jgi:hypothetical protein
MIVGVCSYIDNHPTLISIMYVMVSRKCSIGITKFDE